MVWQLAAIHRDPLLEPDDLERLTSPTRETSESLAKELCARESGLAA
jgi:hypothetical protein